MFILSYLATPADGDDEKIAEIIRKAMQEADLSENVIEAFSRSDLLKMHRVGGYTNALFIQNVQRAGLEKCDLKPGLVDLLVTALESQRGECDS